MDFPAYAAGAVTSGLYSAGKIGVGSYMAYKASQSAKNLGLSNAADIKKLSRQVRLNRGELKRQTFSGVATVTNGTRSAVQLTSIAQGDSDSSRDGNQIRIVGYSIRAHSADKNTDMYITLSPSGQDIDYTDFHAVIGGHVKRTSNTDFKELHYLHNYFSGLGAVTVNRRFRRPLFVRYNGTGSENCVMNKLEFVIKNNTGATDTIDYSIIVYYRD